MNIQSLFFTNHTTNPKSRTFSLHFFGLLLVSLTFSANGQGKLALSSQQIENKLIPIAKSGADSGSYQTIQQRMNALGVPGLSIAVFDGGTLSWAKGYGVCDKLSAQPVDSATIFQAASISKPVTSVAMFRLVDKHLLTLDEDVNAKLRRWKVSDNEFTTEANVTPRRIVSHMSGLSVHGFYGYSAKDSLPSLVQILDGLSPANSKPVRVISKPGTKEIYSGGGFTVLQLLLEDVTGKPFAALMHELVLQPVGMHQSAFSLRIPSSMKPHLAKGYLQDGTPVEGGYRIHPEQAAAGLWATPSDLARFMLSVGDSYRKPGGLLQQSTVQQMFTRVPGGGGLGFGIDGADDSLRYRHSGGNEGFSCYAVAFAQTGRGVVIMTNSDNGTRLIHELIRAIAREYQWSPMWPRE